jgi:hypothetical protein
MVRINLLKTTLTWQTRQIRRDLERHPVLAAFIDGALYALGYDLTWMTEAGHLTDRHCPGRTFVSATYVGPRPLVVEDGNLFTEAQV